jgi:3,4-dihydroxy 2-butanone 4-phosphate synthase/GTP cyclohydrolase II
MFHTISEAMTDLKQGKPVIVVDDEDRENEGDFLTLSENVTPEVINFMITHGKGLVCMPITRDLAVKMNLSMMEKHNTDPFGTAFTVSVDHVDTTTGISAWERADTIKAFTNAEARPEDFKRPGHVFPLIAEDGGVLIRPGHTEAAVDLAKLCGAFPSGVICEIIKDDGTMARVPDLQEIAEEFDLKMINIQELIEYRKKTEAACVDFFEVGYMNN